MMKNSLHFGGLLSNSCQMKNVWQHLTAKLIIAHYTRKDNTRQVYLRVIIAREQLKIDTGVFVPASQWNPNTESVKGKSQEALDTNLILNELKQRAINIGIEYRLKQKPLTIKMFKEIWELGSIRYNLWEYCFNKIEERKGSIKQSTINQHVAICKKLSRIAPNTQFNEIDNSWINNLIAGLKRLDNQPSTINNAKKILKIYLKLAAKDGVYFDFDPSDIKLKSFKSYATHLTTEEVQLLLRYYYNEFTPDTHRKLLQYFLFSCMTGLRYGDVATLTRDNIDDGYIHLIPEKTSESQKHIRFKLNETAVALLNPFGNKLFEHVYSNQYSNVYLKQIASHLGMKKRLTFHVARHTFATMLLSTSGNVEVVRRLLGHSQLAVTMQYVHTSTEELDQSVSKLDTLLE